VAALLLLLGRPAGAAFHVAVIDEVATSVDGDAGQQFVEIRMLATGQTAVAGSVLAAFDADGGHLGDVLVVPSDLTNAGAGLRWLMATAAFQEAHRFAADFTFPPGLLPVADGMVCWGAPGVTPPDPATWDHRDPSRYVDCVAYGRFCGVASAGPPVAATPADHALARTGALRFTNRDFACTSTLTPRTNTGSELVLEGAPCEPVATFLCGQPLAGGPPARTDCLGTWVVKGARRTRPVVRCRDGDPTCDLGTGAGCFVRAQLCFGLGTGAGRCSPAPVTSVSLSGPMRDELDRGNATKVMEALEAVGGEATEGTVTFDPPLATGTCTPPFNLLVPSPGRAQAGGRGARRFVAVTRADRVDRDRLRIVCAP
jgi:hypothetical protein